MTHFSHQIQSSIYNRSHALRRSLSRFTHEIGLFIWLLVLSAWFALLWTYNAKDPAWSTSGLTQTYSNALGAIGAWFADISYFLFGFSIWWCLLAGLQAWLSSLARRMRNDTSGHPNGQWQFWFGLVLVLLASTFLEWLRLHRFEALLPSYSGGIIGFGLGQLGSRYLGFHFGTLFGLIILLIGVSFLFRFSWLNLAEKIGGSLDWLYRYRIEKREIEEDRILGKQAAKERETSNSLGDQRSAERRIDSFDTHYPERRATERRATQTDKTHAFEASNEQNSHSSASANIQQNIQQNHQTFNGEVDFALNLEAASPSVPSNLKSFNSIVTQIRDKVLQKIEHLQTPKAQQNESILPPQPSLLPKRFPTGSASHSSNFVNSNHQTTQTAINPHLQNSQAHHNMQNLQNLQKSAPTFQGDLTVQTTQTSPNHSIYLPKNQFQHQQTPLHQNPAHLANPIDPKNQENENRQKQKEVLLPSVDLLDAPRFKPEVVDPETLSMTGRLIEKKLKDFGVDVRVLGIEPGPVVTRYDIEPAVGVKGSQVVGLTKDLARALSLVSIRVLETVPNKNCMALELPNAKRQSIKFKEIVASEQFQNAPSILTLCLGKDITGEALAVDLAKMPHVLVAGTTGSGKSVGINAMILSLLYKAKASDVRLLLVDPKMLELSVYEGIPHLIAPVVTDMKQAANGLHWCVGEMEKRYKIMSKMGVRNLASYNNKIAEAATQGKIVADPFNPTPQIPIALEHLPHIVIVIDELADLMMVAGKKVEELVTRLAQKARAAGIHLILATQRPSVDVITGLIKANIPTRIAFQVSSKIDSRTILDQMGAEALLGLGDMLYLPTGAAFPTRVHGAFVSDDEIHRVVEFLKTQGNPEYMEGVLDIPVPVGFELGIDNEDDPLYDQAVEVVLKDRKANITHLQRKLRIGYTRAARLLKDMETAGLVSTPVTNTGQRDILVPYQGS